MFEAVLWDFGGVLTTSPFEAFNRFESERGLPRDFIRSINSTNPDTNAWAQLESSEISTEEFDEKFALEAIARGHQVRGQEVLALLSGDLRPDVVQALKIIKSKFRVGCITNNVKNAGVGAGMASSSQKAQQVSDVMDLFDVVIESSKVGMRKPEPGIYTLACREMGIAANRTIFLDDLGINLKPAKALGMTTIKVLNGTQAINELELHLNLDLR